MSHFAYIIGSKFFKSSLCVLTFIYFTNSLLASKTDKLFKSDEVIKMELRFDLSAINNDRNGIPENHDGELIYYTPNGKAKKLSVKLTVRGRYRLDTAKCNFPPLLVNFKKNEVKNTLFDNQNKLKLVTPCQNDIDVIEEYIIYKMYNQITDISFKVRLVKILYFDTRRGKKIFEKYSYFIENKNHVAERSNTVVKDIRLTPFDLDRGNFKKMAVFQYMVGNNDWYTLLNQNIIIMQPNDSSRAPYAVPYDFDLSGFVNAFYDKRESEGRSPHGRLYKGLCYKTDEFAEVFKFYQELRPTFESIINNMELLSEKTRKQDIKYIESFYKVIESQQLIKKEFLDKCESTIDYKISY